MKCAVMVVEDDLDIRQAIGELLVDEGYDVLLAAHGLDALTQLRTGRRPHVILLDLMMPVMDGCAFRAELDRSGTLSQIPLVVLSADANGVEKAAAIRAWSHLKKPIDIEDLLRLLSSFGEHAAPAASS